MAGVYEGDFLPCILIRYLISYLIRQRGRVDRAPNLKSVGRGFKSRSDHYVVVLSSPEFNFSAALVNSQLVCLLPVGILNVVIFF